MKNNNTQTKKVPQRLFLNMFIATAFVIASIITLLLHEQRDEKNKRLISQGSNLTQALSRYSLTQLLEKTDDSILNTAFNNNKNTDLLYIITVNQLGKQLNQISMPNTSIPSSVLSPSIPSLKKSIVRHSTNSSNVIEFHSVIKDDVNEVSGYLMLGYNQAQLNLFNEKSFFYISISLPIFLLMSILYLMIRRETKQLIRVNDDIKDIIGNKEVKSLNLNTGAFLTKHMSGLNVFVEVTKNKIQQLESSKEDLHISNKFLAYNAEIIKTALQSLPDGILILDEAGTINFANKKLSSLLHNEKDILDKKPNEFFTNPDVVAFLSQKDEQFANINSEKSLVFSPSRAKDVKIEIKTLPLYSHNDLASKIGTIAIFKDITKQEQEHSNDSALISQFAHELQKPLASINKYQKALLDVTKDKSDKEFNTLSIITKKTNQLSKLTKYLITISKIEMGVLNVSRSQVNMHSLLQDTFDIYAKKNKGKELNLTLDLPPTLSPISLDKNLIRLSISNLLSNAIKYSNDKGAVTLKASETGSTFKIQVIDKGIGIDEAEQNKIFDKFYRSKNKQAKKRVGYGLGLTLANSIVHLHHGNIRVDSTPQQGSTFTIELQKLAS